MSDCAPSGATAGVTERTSRAHETRFMRDPPRVEMWHDSPFQFRIPHSALVHRHSPTQRSYSTGTTPPCSSTSMPDGSR